MRLDLTLTTTASVVVTGSAAVGEVLTISLSAMPAFATPDSMSVQWRRDGVDISGATSTRYTIQAADEGTDLSAVVTLPSGQISSDNVVNVPAGAPATAPAAFTAGDWTLSDQPSAGGDTLSIDILALPSDGGSAITALEYSLNGGSSWTALAGTGTGARTITVLAETQADVQIRAVNAVGAGAASDTKSATPTSLGDVLSAKVLDSTEGSAQEPADSAGGYVVEVVMRGDHSGAVVDPDKVSFNVTSPGYVDGVLTTVSRSFKCRDQRRWYLSPTTGLSQRYRPDDGSGNTILHLVLDSAIYAGDSNVQMVVEADWISGLGADAIDIADTGDLVYPMCKGQWATEDRRPLLLRDATFEVLAQSLHSFEFTGKRRPADAVIFEITNGSTTVTQTVNQITNSTYYDEVDAYLADVFGANFGTGSDQNMAVTRPANMPAEPVFACTVDLAAAGFALGDELTVTARCCPFVGNAQKVSDGVQDSQFKVQRHRIVDTTRKYVFVDLSMDPDQAVNPTPQPGVYDNIADAMANPIARVGSAVVIANRGIDGNGDRNTSGNYDDSNEGVVILVKKNSGGQVQMGTSRSIGTAGSDIVIENDVIGVEILPAPGEDGATALMSRNYRPDTHQEDGDFPGPFRAYGLGINTSQTKVMDLDMGDSGIAGHATFYLSGSPTGTTPAAAELTNARHFIIGGDLDDIPQTFFAPNASVRGTRIARDGEVNNNFATMTLGGDLGSNKLLTSLSGSGITANHKLRWSTITASAGGQLVTTADIDHAFGPGFLLCACHTKDNSGPGYSISADFDVSRMTELSMLMTTFYGDRANLPYDQGDNASGLPQTSGPKHSNEIFGCVLPSENHKTSHFNYDASDPDPYSRWGVNEAGWYGSMRAHNVVLASYAPGFSGTDHLPYRAKRGYRYGLLDETGDQGGATISAAYPQPFTDSRNGDFSIVDDATWAALASTIALVGSTSKDPNDTDDYATNIVTGVVPADRVPVPFDLFGNAYPLNGTVEAGAVKKP